MPALRPRLHRLVVWCFGAGLNLCSICFERFALTPRYETALSAAQLACEGQVHPGACLYVLATPIGNLADISLRGLHVLQLADTLACEDTRHSQSLLRQYGVDKLAGSWLAVHQHNEATAAEQVILRLQQGQRVVYLSDAGTPGISDPGARLVALVQQAGLRVMPLPGASSITTLMSASGCTGEDGFVFVGFLPSKAMERQHRLQAMDIEPRAQVFLEAPHRIEAVARDLQILGKRPLTVGRELTKQFEEIAVMPAEALTDWLNASTQRVKGEFALVLHALPQQPDRMGEAERILDVLLAELPVKTAVKLAADISGAPRNALQKKPAAES
jgi:16S rRNA (cytidine1402-2'-O)-methyltransferase